MFQIKNRKKKIDSVGFENPLRSNQYLHWVDWMKGIAIIWIFINHAAEAVFGGPYLGNPNVAWPPLQERVAQWLPLSGYGVWNVPVNIWRYVGWLGDQGVSLFLVVSGFGLTWGLLLNYKDTFPLLQFYKKRLFRIYPLWWGVHIIILMLFYITGLKGLEMSAKDPNFYLSLIGLRVFPETFYYYAPAWWFVGLIIQLYFIYPVLWHILRKCGPVRFLLLSCLVAFFVRAFVILIGFEVHIFLYGALFITRLPEFAFGMCFAFWLSNSTKKLQKLMFSAPIIFGALATYIVGTLLSLTWGGMIVAPFVVGMSIFCVLYGILGNKKSSSAIGAKALTWVGKHSYSIYLVHHPIIRIIVPVGALVGTFLAIPFTYISAIGLEKVVRFVPQFLNRWYRKFGMIITGVRIALIGVILFFCAIGVELLVQSFDPQEVRGWGERPSLEPHDTFGWYLIPNKTTRLRWESYDYYVTSNELGFPGPSYPEEKESGTIRILTIGDAFTSAEGVNTDQAWPRLLESDLASRLPNSNIEVINFAITGYGPNQYAEVARMFIPKYHPDIVIIGFFINDFTDVSRSNSDFQANIGFNLPSATGWYSTVNLTHTRNLLRRTIRELVDTIRNRPDFGRYSYAKFLLKEQQDYETGQESVSKRLEQIKKIADEQEAQMILFMIPAPVQVCGPDEITYYPRGFDLSDASLFDFDKPQDLTKAITRSLGIKFFDLRAPLQAVERCPYQPRNLHWTIEGHKVVADYIAEVLLSEKYLLYN